MPRSNTTFAFLACALLCLAGVTHSSDPDIRTVTLTFQDSAGGVRAEVAPDNLPGNLRAYLEAIRARKPGKPQRIPVPGEAPGIQDLLDDCMCESPSDSVLITLADGTREAYEVYCGEARRLMGKDIHPLGFQDNERELLAGRWNSLRRRFCPTPFGCSDTSPVKWRSHAERRNRQAWEETRNIDAIAYHWTGLLDSIGSLAPEAVLTVSLHSRDGKLYYVSDVRVPPGFKHLVPTFIRGAYRKGKAFPAEKEGEYRINAYNFDNVK